LLLEELASEVRAERRGNPLELLLELNEALYRTFAYGPTVRRLIRPSTTHCARVRRLRIPCRYVSGYLFHEAESNDRSSAGATHA
jgi:hypothetical protein